MTSSFHTPKRLLIVTEHFFPSTSATAQLISDLAIEIQPHVDEITILTSTSHNEAKLQANILVHRLLSRDLYAHSILSKAISGLFFAVKDIIWILTKSKPQTRLLIVSNPPFIGFVGLISHFLIGAPYFFLLQDLFPRSAEISGVLPAKGPITSFWRSFTHVVCRFSKRTIVLSEAMKSRAVSEYGLTQDQLVVIPNWAVETGLPIPKSSNPLAKKWNTDTRLTVQYSGNFGRLHDIITILESARLLASYPVCFLFVGGGAKLDQITSYKRKYGLDNVLLFPFQARSDLPYSLAACDLSVVSLSHGSQDTVAPSKFYGIIASGKPVLLIADPTCDLATDISDNNLGFVVAPGDPVLLSTILIKLLKEPHLLSTMGRNAHYKYYKTYGRSASAASYLKVLFDE